MVTRRGNASRSPLAQVLLSVSDHALELDDPSLIERELTEVIDPTVHPGRHSIQHDNGGATPNAGQYASQWPTIRPSRWGESPKNMVNMANCP